jgi:2-polyprenyl-3-methyl-5-hydroxy-6-metoxy-1,4-benzoquinol methylase
MVVDSKAHWDQVYQTKAPTAVTWYQPHAELSLRLIRGSGNQLDDPIIDVGGGASSLVDDLLVDGFRAVTLLDISSIAIEVAQGRLGGRSKQVTWVEGDVTTVDLPRAHYGVWHDRAVFHFLTCAEDRRRYVARVLQSVRPGGHVIIATFALDGPSRCSGLDVVRYSPVTLQQELGSRFSLVNSVDELHHTPFGTDQKFVYCVWRRELNGA